MKYRVIDDRLGNDSGPYTAQEIDDFCRENGIGIVWNSDRSAAYSEDAVTMNYTLLAEAVDAS